MAFPTDVPTLNDPTSSNKLSNPSHSQLHQDVNTNLEAGLTKLGTGSSTATDNTVLRGTGAGVSAWGQIDSGDVSSSTGSGAFVLATAPVFAAADMNGTELILDADADTSITADTDDQIDVKIAGVDDFRFAANTFTALSGSSFATDTISESTSAAGVTIDGLLIKDGKLNTNNSVVTNNYTDSSVTTAKVADGAVTPAKWTNPYKFSAYASGTTALAAGVSTKVAFATEEYDSNDNFASSTYTAPVAGFYNFSAAITITSGAAEVYYIQIYKNGSEWKRVRFHAPGAVAFTASIAADMELAASDTIEIYGFNSSGGAKTVSSGQALTWFMGHLVSIT